MTREAWHKISFGLNALLAVTVVILAARQGSSRTSTRRDELRKSAKPLQVASRTESTQKTPTSPNPTSNWEPWIERLRAAGAPDHVLVQVVLADFNERWRRRFDELQHRIERGESPDSALATLGRDRDYAQEQELRNALGKESFKRWDQENTLQSLNLGKIQLTDSQTDTLYDLQKALQQEFRDLEEAKDIGEMDDTELVAWQKRIQTEFDSKLKTLLGDERFAAMQTPPDGGADQLRRSLRNVKASEAQFESLLAAQSQWTERRDELNRQIQTEPSKNVAYEEQIKALDLARDQEFQRVLGANNFETYQKEQDANYGKMKLYANVWGMNADNIDYVYRSLKTFEKNSADYQQQAHALEQQGKAVDWNSVNLNLQQISKQTEEALRNYLGQERYNKLKQNDVLPFQATP